MFAQPGKKLLFMGGELGQPWEWAHEGGVGWHLLEEPGHRGILTWVSDLNRMYREERALHALDFDAGGFEWVEGNDPANGVLAFLRKAPDGRDVLCVFNLTPVPRPDYRLGVPRAGVWRELLNGDAEAYGGSGWGNLGGIESTPVPSHGRFHSIRLAVPPLAAVFLHAPESEAGA
jgi:1,4-alpha-glucan branching enzyme